MQRPRSVDGVFRFVVGFGSGAIAFAAAIHAQATQSITNLAQLAPALDHENYLVADIQLEATVFACSTNTGVLILRDASGAELLEMDSLDQEFQPGDRIRIEFSRCFIEPGDLGVYVSAAPLLNNDGLHAPRTMICQQSFQAGRYPVRLDWFNQFSAFMLEVSCVATNPDGQSFATSHTNLIHAVRAECFQGFWSRLPDFRLFSSAKVTGATNFDIGIRTRDDMVGIRFEGYFDAPQTGEYLFSLRSDDGSRLWVGKPEVPVRKIGASDPPPAPYAYLGASMISLNDRRLATIEGRVRFVSRVGKGLRFELCSEQNFVSVVMADAGSLEPMDLLNAYVRVSGVAGSVLTESQRVVLGRIAVAGPRELSIIENPPGKGAVPSVLETVMQVHSLSSDYAARRLPVKIRGVVTAIGQPLDHWMAIQDETRGSFVRLTFVTNCIPNVGESWSVAGHTEPGDFAPIIIADHATLLGKGQLPEPAHPSWNQLVNGSMDVQWVELQGLVTGVQSNSLSLLLPEGRQEIRMPEWGESELKAFDKAVVRIRGALFAAWNAETHEVRVGNITMRNASITVDKPAPDDPFDAPEKTPRGLFRFDAKATPFQRVRVRGQVTYVDSKRVFLQQAVGMQIHPVAPVNLRVGDIVEAVGWPEISGASPQMREALVRKTGDGLLPEAPLVSDSELADEHLASTRIRVEGNLAGQRVEEASLVLQIQTRTHLFVARVANAGSLRSLRMGSQLSLTGVYVSDAPGEASVSDTPRFELLLNTPTDLVVVSEPSWWTLQRLLSVVGVLLITLMLAAVWIALLRRRVAQRTLQLQHEIRERERAERQHALEAERSRIARDLHDDLGSSLTEINVLASTGQRPRAGDGSHPTLFKTIADKARGLVAALDVIVWAVDPEDNSLQSLADYLSGYTREYLANPSIACRFKIPVTLPDVQLDGEIRHELLMVVKETLNNIVRHAGATEVEFQLSVTADVLEIRIVDNGKGFDPNTEAGGYGLRNRSARLTKIGGGCHIESRAGVGTTVRVQLPLPRASTGQRGDTNTTFG